MYNKQLTEEELQDLIINAHAEFLEKNPPSCYEQEDLAYYIGVKYFEKLGLLLVDDDLFEGDKKVAKNVVVTYNLEEFKIDLTFIEPAHKLKHKFKLEKKNG
jgi:hypothetical protein